jgi:uroporphyrinogen III methyltransferase/synthase
VITGHEAMKDESDIDWAHLARGADTLVFLMGVKNLPEIAASLVAHGRPASTPAAVVRWGTTPEQRTVTGTLADIAERVAEAGLAPPAITVVGEVVRLRETLSWFENRPLFGKRVLITRTRRQASSLAWLLAEQGAIPVELPAIEIEPIPETGDLAAAIERLREGAYAWCGFTSANAVELFFEQLAGRGLDARAFAGARVFAIGPATAEALRERGIAADVVPREYVAEAVVEALSPGDQASSLTGAGVKPGDRVLLPRAEAARAELLRSTRCRSTAPPSPRTRTPRHSPPSARAASTSSPSPRPPPCATCSPSSAKTPAPSPARGGRSSPASARSPPRPRAREGCRWTWWHGSTLWRGWWRR